PDAKAALAFGIEPAQTAMHGDTRVVGCLGCRHMEVDVLEDTGVGGAARAFVARNDVVGEHGRDLQLARREELPLGLTGRRLWRRRRRLIRSGVWDNGLLTFDNGEWARDRGRAENLERRSPRDLLLFVAHSAPALRCCAMKSAVRHARARIVHVGFLSACDTNGAPSAMKRFLQSYA